MAGRISKVIGIKEQPLAGNYSEIAIRTSIRAAFCQRCGNDVMREEPALRLNRSGTCATICIPCLNELVQIANSKEYDIEYHTGKGKEYPIKIFKLGRENQHSMGTQEGLAKARDCIAA